MGRCSLKNVQQKGGYFYFRREIAGKDSYVRIPAPHEEGFSEIYERLLKDEPVRAGHKPGTIGALVVAYRKSPEYLGNRVATRTNQARYLDMIEAEHGHRTVSGVRPAKVRAMRDAMKDTPGKANNWLSVFRAIMAYASSVLDLRSDNPASDIKALAIGEHEPWPADLLRVAIDEATPMTRLAIVTGLCSGQRVSDCIRMQYGWIRDGIMELSQKKSTKQVAIPIHPLWTEELARLPRRSVTLLYERSGVPFKTTGAIQARLRDLMENKAVKEVLADLVAREAISTDTSFTFHGLRKNACCYLLELGLSDTEVGAMLGMSPEMVRHYGKRMRALMIARGAAERVTSGKILALTPKAQRG